MDAVLGRGCPRRCGCAGGGGSGGRSDAGDTRIRTEIVQPLQPEQPAVGGVEGFSGIFPNIVLVEGEEGAAIAQARRRDGADFDLGCRGEAAQVEGFESALGEVEAAIKEGGWFDNVRGRRVCGRRWPCRGGGGEVLDLSVAADYIVKVKTACLLESVGEGEGSVEIGERAIDKADAAEGVGGRKVR